MAYHQSRRACNAHSRHQCRKNALQPLHERVILGDLIQSTIPAAAETGIRSSSAACDNSSDPDGSGNNADNTALTALTSNGGSRRHTLHDYDTHYGIDRGNVSALDAEETAEYVAVRAYQKHATDAERLAVVHWLAEVDRITPEEAERRIREAKKAGLGRRKTEEEKEHGSNHAATRKQYNLRKQRSTHLSTLTSGGGGIEGGAA